MFGFKKNKPLEEGFRLKKLPEIRDCLRDLTGEAMNVYVGTVVGSILNLGKTSNDIERARTRMLVCLQKYVQSEILLDRQEHGGEVTLSELAGLKL